MKREILGILCCPICKQDLRLFEEEVANNEVIDGILECDDCQKSFEIIKGVPRMIVDLDDRKKLAESWSFEWIKREEGKFEIDTLYGETEEQELNRFFDFLDVTPDDLRGKVVLDAGCGCGRLTKALGKYGAQIIGIDIATSIEHIYECCNTNKNVHIIQADILNLPFKNVAFDYVWSKLAICYVRNPEQAFRNLSELIKSSGKLFVSVPSRADMSFVNKLKVFLEIADRIPRGLLFYLSWCLAPMLCFAKRVLRKQGTSLRSNAFFIFNALQSEFFTMHTFEEVKSWFVREKFDDIIYIPGHSPGHRHAIPVRGTKR
ncbi:MAG: methyltransferase domain-containing protein [Desulfobacteraceae bacterium]|nr:methyltransferase domain-containing protein [Desulfobacteraceae bacterium]